MPKYIDCVEEISNAGRHHNGTKIEYLERRKRLIARKSALK